ncbi:MAG: hypothetical protein II875_15150 [Clostridia bacterium]|nr:hypothetical protein [Oscillospiraceae bacterium]MBQ3763322.1 hypothetical protein [Clostridia bacterium]
MPENTIETAAEAQQSVSIHTQQITDSCLDKDCIEDLRVYLTEPSQEALDGATTARARVAELLFAEVSVEQLNYKSGYHAVDVTFYYRISGDAVLGGIRPTTITGLAVFAKRVVLCGGAGAAKVFSSADPTPSCDTLLNGSLPTAIVEALDPMILSARLREPCAGTECETELTEVPPIVEGCFDDPLVMGGDRRRLFVTVGQFSTVRLERGTQITIPVYSYSAPTKECCDDEGCEEDPCELFSRIDFPMDAFFPDSACGSTADPTGGCVCNA